MQLKWLLFPAMLLAAACGDDDVSVCEEAYNRQKECVAELDCNSLTGDEKSLCELVQSMFGYTQLLDYEQRVESCESAGSPTPCQCEGSTKEEAEKVMSADFDWTICTYPGAIPMPG